MMKILKTKSVLLGLVFSLCFIACLAFLPLSGITEAKAYEADFASEPNLKAEYTLGQTLTLNRVNLNVNGESLPASSVTLKTPDGSYYRYTFTDSLSHDFVLDLPGYYEVFYNVESNGIVYTSQESFTVNKDMYTFTKSESYTDYIENSQYSGKTGVKVNLKINDYMLYNRIIDLNDLYEKHIPFLDLFPLTSNAPKRDYVEFCIKLIDVYDPENFITIYTRNPNINDGQLWEKIYTYTRAAAPGQPFVGLEYGFDGALMRVHKNSSYYGKMTQCSFYGWEEDFSPVGERSLAYYFDLSEKRLFVENEDYNEDNWVVDFDDTAYMSSLWSGFTTGECYLQISLSSQSPDMASFFIKSIAGQDITKDYFTDELGAKLTVDTDYDDLPKGRVNTLYPLPSFSATSSYSDRVILSSRVYYAYETAGQYQVSIDDGYFLPKEIGKYTLIYSAKDIWGNVSEHRYDINIAESLDPITIVIDGEPEEVYAGYSVSALDVMSDGGTGKHTLTVTAENLNNGTVYNVAEVTKNPNEISYNFSNVGFLPMSTGWYKITYAVSDYIDTKEESYLLKVVAEETPVIIDDVTVNDYYIKGKNYYLPEITAYDFYNVAVGAEPEKIACDIYVFENGVERKLSGNLLNTNLTEGSLQIKYSANGGTPLIKESRVIDVGQGNANFMTKYFVGTAYLDVAAASDSVTLNTSTDNKIDFINPILANTFELDYSFVDNSNFEYVNFYLTDSVDADASIKVSAKKSGGRVLYYLNDDFSKAIADIALSYTDRLAFTFNASENTVSPVYGVSNYVNKSLSGNAFDGFGSRKVKLKIEFKGVSQNASLKIYSINNQTINQGKYDTKNPEVTITSDYAGLWNINDTLVLTPFVVADVLDPEVYAEVTVTDPSGKIVKAFDGTTLNKADPFKEYSFKASMYGRYRVSIALEDGRGNDKTYTFSFNVFDTVPPVIQVNETPISGKVNTQIVLPTAVATDNSDGNVEVHMTVTSPNYRTSLLDGYNAFTPRFSGVYTVTYMAYDKNGNLAIKTVKVTVS